MVGLCCGFSDLCGTRFENSGLDTMTKKKSERKALQVDDRFARVIWAFAKHPGVTHGGPKGFGAGALKINGKIFAMISSKGEFVVKLPKERVDEMEDAGKGEPYDPGHGRRMKEWLVVTDGRVDWTGLAKEACEYVKARKAETLTDSRPPD